MDVNFCGCVTYMWCWDLEPYLCSDRSLSLCRPTAGGPYSLELTKKHFFPHYHSLQAAQACLGHMCAGGVAKSGTKPCMKPWWSFDRWMSALPVPHVPEGDSITCQTFLTCQIFSPMGEGKRTDRQSKWKQNINTLKIWKYIYVVLKRQYLQSMCVVTKIWQCSSLSKKKTLCNNVHIWQQTPTMVTVWLSKSAMIFSILFFREDTLASGKHANFSSPQAEIKLF